MQLRGTPPFVLLMLSLLLGLTGCGDSTPTETVVQRAVTIESSDECHLCGMIIADRPGPKGELYQRGQSQVHKFCSTRDLFAYLLDPEYRHQVETVFVHDMAVTPWDHPDDETFIDARQAWYVVDSSKSGAMGPTLASFADQQHAQAFADQFGGTLYRFDQITLELISSL